MSEAKKNYYKNFGIKLENKTNDFDADRYIKELELKNEKFIDMMKSFCLWTESWQDFFEEIIPGQIQ